jgi:hypothetical protein
MVRALLTMNALPMSYRPDGGKLLISLRENPTENVMEAGLMDA